MRIFLSGLMGSGKSTVARALGQSAGLPVFDIDELIEREAGQSVPALFAARGEEAFRAIEANAILAMIEREPNGVFSLGGGAVTNRSLRRTLLRSGLLATLDAPTETLATRVGSGEGRPLLQGRDVAERLEMLRSARAEAYAECHVRLDTSHATPDEIARTLLERAAIAPLAVPLGTRTYSVYVGAGRRADLAARVHDLAPVSSVMVVSDTEVGPHWARTLASDLQASGLQVHMVEIGAGESAKNLTTVDALWNAALDAGLDRNSLLVGIGGGVVGDLSGFAAATLLRGVRVAHVPTTLLSMVDSAIGGKTGFDVRQGKNLVGAFHQPSFVISDGDVLATLPDAELRAGLAEVVKTAWIAGESEVAELERDAEQLLAREPNAIERAIRMASRVKAQIVTEDERESGMRALLNLGHTLAHAIEAASGYSGLRHGEAVALGCAAAFRVSAGLGGESAVADGERMTVILSRLGLPVEFDSHLTERVLSFLGSDKKRKGKSLHYVVPGKPGDVRVVPLPIDEVVRLLRI